MLRSCQAALHGNHMVLVQCKANALRFAYQGSSELPVPGYVLHPLGIWELVLLLKRVQMQGGSHLVTGGMHWQSAPCGVGLPGTVV